MKHRDAKLLKKNKEVVNWVRFFLIGYSCLFVIGFVFYGSIVFSVAFGFLVLLFIDRYAAYLELKRANEMRHQFSDLLYSLSASVATGRQLPTAILEAKENLGQIYEDDSPMMVELQHMTTRFHENRENEERILWEFAERSKVAEITNFVEVYLTCRVTGGDLQQIISDTSHILMEKMSIEREIKVMISQKKFEGKLISVMPILVILSLNLTSPDYLDNLYQTVPGRLVMTVALLGIYVSYALTEKITNIEA